MKQVNVHKNGNFTVVSNRCLKDSGLSNKARGLLCTMLSFPPNWNYSVKGLSKICTKDGPKAIHTQLTELEKAGYVVRGQSRNENGKFSSSIFEVFEKPWWELTEEEKNNLVLPLPEIPSSEISLSDNPSSEMPLAVFSSTENGAQLNTEELNTEILNTHSINNPSINLDVMDRTDVEKQIKENIEFDIIRYDIDENRLQGIVDIMTDMVCTTGETTRINRENIPSVNVAKRILSLDSEHIKYAVDCMNSSPVGARNQRAYIQSVLYNAPTVMNNDMEMLYHRTNKP